MSGTETEEVERTVEVWLFDETPAAHVTSIFRSEPTQPSPQELSDLHQSLDRLVQGVHCFTFTEKLVESLHLNALRLAATQTPVMVYNERIRTWAEYQDNDVADSMRDIMQSQIDGSEAWCSADPTAYNPARRRMRNVIADSVFSNLPRSNTLASMVVRELPDQWKDRGWIAFGEEVDRNVNLGLSEADKLESFEIDPYTRERDPVMAPWLERLRSEDSSTEEDEDSQSDDLPRTGVNTTTAARYLPEHIARLSLSAGPPGTVTVTHIRLLCRDGSERRGRFVNFN